MKRACQFLLLVLLIGIPGCKQPDGKPSRADIQSALDLVSQYFEAIRAKDFDRAMGFYSPLMFTLRPGGMSESQWRKLLESTPEKLGDLITITPTFAEYGNRASSDMPTGTYVRLTVDVVYTKHTTKDSILVHRPLGGSDRDMKIVSYLIGLQDLLIDE